MKAWITATMALAMALSSVGTSHAGIVISELDLANNKVELVNSGPGAVDMSSWWFCNRVNGSPFYSMMASATIDAANSTATSLNMAAGELLTLELASAILPDANGELGIYNTNAFGSASAIEDYILWGANGIRDLTAQNAGIWTDNDSIDVSGMSAGDTIQLLAGQPGNASSDYGIGPGTIGSPQGPIPVEAASWSKVKSLFD